MDLQSIRSTINPLSWGTPAKVVGAAALLLFAYMAVSGGISTAWATYVANKALRGVASAISDIDDAEKKSAAHEATIQALAARAAELQQKIDELNAEQARLKAERVKAVARAGAADAERARARAEAAARPKVESLEQARDALNAYLEGAR